eukprot:1149815-Pelagomonas_calceolata.AAC.5
MHPLRVAELLTMQPGAAYPFRTHDLHTSRCNKATVSTLLCCALCRPSFLHYSRCREVTISTVVLLTVLEQLTPGVELQSLRGPQDWLHMGP